MEVAYERLLSEALVENPELILRLVENTVIDFVQFTPALVTSIVMDVDLYSSTMRALALFDMQPGLLLPHSIPLM